MRKIAFGSVILFVFLTASLFTALPAKADTHGNTTQYEANQANDPYSTCTTGSACNVASSWWSNSTTAVTQRYGCTVVPFEPDPAPYPLCPAPYNAGWHQGIDIGLVTASIYSRVEGTVADYVYTTCLARGCATLGYLAIRTYGGHVIYLLHGSPTAAYAQLGKQIHVNDLIYTTGANGSLSTGYHLHFEVHNSVVGSLLCSSEPAGSPGSSCDDINPEQWVAGNICTSANLTSNPTSPGIAGNSGSISISGTSSGCPTPQYEFWIQPPGGSWGIVQPYSSSPSFNWNSTGKSSGGYGLGVWVHDITNPDASTYDVNFGFVFTLSGCPTVTPVPSPSSPQAWGPQVTIYATNPGCPNPEYRFWILPPGGNWTMVKDYSTGTYNYLDVWNTAGPLGGTYYPAGTYYAGVWVRPSGTAGANCGSLGCFDTANSVPYILNPTPCTGVTASAVPTTVAHSSSNGQHVTISASATCPNSNPQYEFWLRTDTTGWQLIQAYSTTATYDWNSTGASVGTVYFGVWVKDVSSSTSTFDANNPTTVTVT